MKNLSAEPTNKLYAWLPHDLEAEEIVILPDACPGKSPLPTGTAVRLNQANWRKFAVSDVGCGMRLLRSDLTEINLTQWNRVADLLKANKGQLGNLGGDISLVRATAQVNDILNSLSHGTGRILPRGECKMLAAGYDFAALRKRVLMPDCIQNASLRTEGPYAYRDLDQCLALLEGYIEEVDRFAVIAYMGHL